MALLDWMTDATGPVVEGRGVMLRPPRIGDYAAWADLREASRDYLQPWEPAWPDDDLTKAAWRRRLTVYAREMELGNAWPFFVLDPTGRTLYGAITLSNIRRGVAETGTLGYWIGRPFAGEGHGTAAVKALARHAFRQLKLHRLEASCLPSNAALGLGPLAPGMLFRRLPRLALPQDRAQAEESSRPREPGSEIVARLRMRGGETCIWRGVWLEDGVRAAGVVAPETSSPPPSGQPDRPAGPQELHRPRSRAPGQERRARTGRRRRRPPAPPERGPGPRARRPGAGRPGLAPGRRLPGRGHAGPHRRGRVRRAVRPGASSPPSCCARRWSSPCGWPASTSTRPCRSAPWRPRAARTRPRPPSCCAAPNWPSRPPPPPAVAGPPPTAARWRPTACRAWPWRPTCAAPSAAARSTLLPARRAPVDRRAVGLRGPGPLDPPAPRHAAARRVPAADRRDGPDERAGRAHDAHLGPQLAAWRDRTRPSAP
jgi:ribosomal-protein-alanine N-acetyltransferase